LSTIEEKIANILKKSWAGKFEGIIGLENVSIELSLDFIINMKFELEDINKKTLEHIEIKFYDEAVNEIEKDIVLALTSPSQMIRVIASNIHEIKRILDEYRRTNN